MANTRAPRLDGMNEKRMAFVREYLLDMSPKDAAVRAGYPPEKAVYTGNSLMKVPPVRDAIARAMAERSKRTGVNADRVLDNLGKILFGDPRAVFHPDGRLKAPSEMNDDDAMMIAGVKTRRIVEVGDDGKIQNAEIQEVKLIDKTSVLALAMRHLGMMNDKITLDVGGTLAEQLSAAQARVAGGAVGAVIEGTPGLTREEAMSLMVAEGGEAIEAEWTEVVPAANAWEDLI